jgi:hypothetical protein
MTRIVGRLKCDFSTGLPEKPNLWPQGRNLALFPGHRPGCEGAAAGIDAGRPIRKTADGSERRNLNPNRKNCPVQDSGIHQFDGPKGQPGLGFGAVRLTFRAGWAYLTGWLRQRIGRAGATFRVAVPPGESAPDFPCNSSGLRIACPPGSTGSAYLSGAGRPGRD